MFVKGKALLGNAMTRNEEQYFASSEAVNTCVHDFGLSRLVIKPRPPACVFP